MCVVTWPSRPWRFLRTMMSISPGPLGVGVVVVVPVEHQHTVGVGLSAARSGSSDELAEAYRAAIVRATESDPIAPSNHPVGSLTSTIPRLVRLAATVHILHVLPTRASDSTPDGVALVAQLCSTVDQTAAGSLRLCHLAIESADRSDPLDEWVAYALDQASDALPRVSYTVSPPSLISHAEEAARWVAVAIDQAHADPPAAPRAIADALSHLLVVCVFADVLADRPAV
jgi:hypothetical protein